MTTPTEFRPATKAEMGELHLALVAELLWLFQKAKRARKPVSVDHCRVARGLLKDSGINPTIADLPKLKKLHELLVSKLMEMVSRPDPSAAELGVVATFLQSCGITKDVAMFNARPSLELVQSLPFLPPPRKDR